MKKVKPEVNSAAPPVPLALGQPEKPFVLLVFGVVCAATMFGGCVLNLIRPFRPLTLGPVLFMLTVSALSGCMAYFYGREIIRRVRKWRGTGTRQS